METKEFAPSIQMRFNFTYTFLVGAATLTNLAIAIDRKGKDATETEQSQHRAYIAGSIMQSVAALESEVWSLLHHGPGHHLGSTGQDNKSSAILSIIANSIDNLPLLRKYDLILQITRDKKLDLGGQPMQELSLVIGLRNELTHFKSLWTDELDRKELFKALEALDATPPSFYLPGGNFFPHICLSFRRAKWSLDTVVSFIDFYYKELGIKSPLEGYDRKTITV